MSRVNKNILQTVLFIAIFGGLLTVASFFDLEISKLLATEYLEAGTFYSTNPVGLVVEYIGSFPIFALGIFACLVFMHHIYNLKDNKKYFSIIFVLLIYGLLYYFLSESFKYFVRNNFAPELEDTYRDAPIAIGILASLTLLIGTGLIFFYKNVDIKKNEKLLNFAFVIVIAALGYFVNEMIKGPMGRMRFRGMAYINYDFQYFTNWFEASYAKTIPELANVAEIYPDAFKSFPSGHTYAAGVSYSLICLPYVCEEFNNVKGKIISYAIPILYTGFVAFYRIRVGAHFMSDVLVGGPLAYVLSEVGKYFFFVRPSYENIEEKEEIAQ